MSLTKLKKELENASDSKKASVLKRFFKTGPGEYGEGDIFLGIIVPVLRKLALKYQNLDFPEIQILIKSKIHEERMLALFILIHRYQNSPDCEKRAVYLFYYKNIKYINNWDLVDISAPLIVGNYLFKRDKTLLFHLAVSNNLWKRRIAIISTFFFIKNNKFDETLNISNLLLHDNEDLIHKSVGWMLREVGKRDLKSEKTFLNKHYLKMPRTMLRYAIEKFPEPERQAYLKGLKPAL